MKVFLLGIFILSTVSGWAQKDFGLWAGIDLRGKINKDLTVGLEVQGRFESNVTVVEQTFVSPYVKYDLHKHIRVGCDYRLSNVPESGFFGDRYRHRVTLDLEFRNLLELFLEDQRLNITARVRGTNRFGEGDLNNSYLRGRLKLAYNLPGTKLEPHIAGEFFYHFNDQLLYSFNEVRAVHRVNKYRVRAGLSYPLSSAHSVKLFYIVEPQIESPNTDFILGVGYTLNIDRLID